MPEGFDYCKSHGGRVRTKKLKGGKYIHICFIDGKSYAGEVKTKRPEDMTSKEYAEHRGVKY